MKEPINRLRAEVIKMINKEHMFDILVTSEEGRGSHCIFCPVCFYTDILLLGKKEVETGEIINSILHYHIPKNEEYTVCKCGKKSILVDPKLVIPEEYR